MKTFNRLLTSVVFVLAIAANPLFLSQWRHPILPAMTNPTVAIAPSR